MTIYQDVTLPLIENTTMKMSIVNGEPRQYYITPIDNYILHDKILDWTDINPDTMEETETILGFSQGTCSCSVNYDFIENPREFYTKLKL